MPLVILALALLQLLVLSKTEHIYEKAGAKDWYKTNPQCGGRFQSPIAFWDEDITVNNSIPELQLTGYDRFFDDIYLENNGHTIKLNINADNPPLISGGTLKSNYRLLQAHFHWSAFNLYGSEHAVGTDFFPMEMHLVHVKAGLDLASALKQPDGLAVLGVLFEVSNEKDAGETLQPFVEVLHHVKHKRQKHKLKQFKLSQLLPHDTSNFFSYHGSLTTPPCSEVVTWTVFTEPHGILNEQLTAFRNIQHHSAFEDQDEGSDDIEGKLLFNHRPIQDTNGRKVVTRRHKLGLPRRCVIVVNSTSSTVSSSQVLGMTTAFGIILPRVWN